MSNDLLVFSELTDAQLIQFVQNRDEAAFAELMTRYKPRIWRVILTNSRPEAFNCRCLPLKELMLL